MRPPLLERVLLCCAQNVLKVQEREQLLECERRAGMERLISCFGGHKCTEGEAKGSSERASREVDGRVLGEVYHVRSREQV